MRDGKRLVLLKDLFELRHDTAAAAKHIAKTYGAYLCRFGIDILRIELAYSFRRTHYIRRANRFVGGDEDEILAPVLHRQIDRVLRSDDVVDNRAFWIVLTHRYVLVGCGMNHDLGTLFGKELFKLVAVFYIAEIALSLYMQLLIDAVEVVLAVFYKHKLSRSKGFALSAQLAAYAAARTRDEDLFVFDKPLYRLLVQIFWFACKQIFDGDIFDTLFEGVVDFDLFNPTLLQEINQLVQLLLRELFGDDDGFDTSINAGTLSNLIAIQICAYSIFLIVIYPYNRIRNILF